jgi:hypothetical protein
MRVTTVFTVYHMILQGDSAFYCHLHRVFVVSQQPELIWCLRMCVGAPVWRMCGVWAVRGLCETAGTARSTGVVPHGTLEGHLHRGGLRLHRRSVTCCLETSLDRRVRSGCSHGCE